VSAGQRAWRTRSGSTLDMYCHSCISTLRLYSRPTRAGHTPGMYSTLWVSTAPVAACMSAWQLAQCRGGWCSCCHSTGLLVILQVHGVACKSCSARASLAAQCQHGVHCVYMQRLHVWMLRNPALLAKQGCITQATAGLLQCL
jgi:hypothetical protein